MSLPDGYGFVFSNGPETARRLLAAADKVGVPQETVRSIQDGYEVPTEVLDAYNDTEDQEFPAPTEGVFSLEPPQTSHEPFVPDTSHEAAEITEDSPEAEEIKEEGESDEEREAREAAERKAAEAAEAEQAQALADEQAAAAKATAEAQAAEQAERDKVAEDAKPAGNAGKDAWSDWAAEYKGYDKSEDLSRDDLKAKYAA